MNTSKLSGEVLQRRSAFVLSEPIQGLIKGLLMLIPALWTEEFFILGILHFKAERFELVFGEAALLHIFVGHQKLPLFLLHLCDLIREKSVIIFVTIVER